MSVHEIGDHWEVEAEAVGEGFEKGIIGATYTSTCSVEGGILSS